MALIEPAESAALISLVAHIDEKLARTLPGLYVPDEFAHDPDLALRRKLRSAIQPISFPDEEGRCAYLWPSSHLTGQDMTRLRIWGRLTGLPSNQLLHLSVMVMSEWLRLHLVQVLAQHEQSGIPFEVLLGGSPPHVRKKRGRSASGSADQGGAHSPPVVPASAMIVLPADLSSPSSPASPSPLSVTTEIEVSSDVHPASDMPGHVGACAADPPPSSRSHRRSARAPSNPASSDASDEGRRCEVLLDQLRQTSDEVRVLWQAVDELRESLEHALCNQAPPDDPPRTLPDVDVESTVEELMEQLQQLPPALLAQLQREIATLENPSCEPPSAVDPPPRKPVRSPTAGSPPKHQDNGRPGKTPDTSGARYRVQQRLF